MIHAVILAGGGGTRLWPLSRTAYPKQFLSLLDQYSLFQHTVTRLDSLVEPGNLWIVTGAEHSFIVQAQLAQLAQLAELPAFADTTAHILDEPIGRNTAAAIGLAAINLHHHDPNAVMIVLPADHWITNPAAFVSLLRTGIEWAQQGRFVTLGVVPDRPATGYGYIQAQQTDAGEPGRDAAVSTTAAYLVERFVEKPDRQIAEQYVSSGQYYWNAGIFIWQAAAILEAIATHMPELYAGLETIVASLETPRYQETLAAVYPGLESVSIDTGVLEQSADQLVVLPADVGWSDLGEWATIHRLSPQDGRGNTLRGSVLAIDSDTSFVHGNGRMIATIGLKNTVIVDTQDALLVCAHNRVQDVRAVVQQLQNQHAEIVATPRTVHRPWGTYTVLEEGPRFKVKRLVVLPGASLSLQLHHHRSEHWVVVAGVAQVTNGEQELQLQSDQSTYIPQGTRHRLANPGPAPLEVIEVQTGSYMGEDDIVRFADQYDRV